MNVDIVGSRRNGRQLSTRHDNDDDDDLLNIRLQLDPKIVSCKSNFRSYLDNITINK